MSPVAGIWKFTLVTPHRPVVGPAIVPTGAGAPLMRDKHELALRLQPELAFTQMSPLKLPIGKVTDTEAPDPVIKAPATVVDHT